MIIHLLRRWMWYRRLPLAVRAEIDRDMLGVSNYDPGIERVVEEGIKWLARAQDQSRSRDGGVARDFSLLQGWNTSYPETTGYIVPTMLDFARRSGTAEFRERGRRMLDWLASIQLPSGGFQGGRIDSVPVVPVTFNTGQILLGLAAGVEHFGDVYRPNLKRAADFLRDSQDPDGCWRRHPTPFAVPGENAYETHVSWGLFEAERHEPGRGYAEAGYKQVDWAIRQQRSNGWFDNCCLTDPTKPLTHTIGYVFRGLLEAHRLSKRPSFLDHAVMTGNALLATQRGDGSLPGKLDCHWRPAASWSCLTGNSQIAHCWLLLYKFTGESRFLDAARAANGFVRSTVCVEGPDETRGAVKGSFPVDGDYGRLEYLNWAVKFTIDSNLLESDTLHGAIH